MNTTLTPPTQKTPRYLLEIERDPALHSLHTRRQYGAKLTRFMNWVDGRKLTRTLAEEYIAAIQQAGASKVTVRQTLAVIRWWARRVIHIALDELPASESDEIERNLLRVIAIPDPKGSNVAPLPAGRHLEEWEILSLIEACQTDPTPAGIRDGALIATAASTLIRNEELRTLKIQDVKYTKDGAEIKIRHGKGDKARIVDIFGKRLEALTRWIELRGVEGEYLFTRIYKSGHISTGEPISYAGTRLVLHKRFEVSSLSKTTTWHDFRRTGVGMLFDNGEDISTIMTITGHVDEKTVRRYDRRPADRRKDALKKLQS